jgi:DNA topoisomerase-1
MSHRTIDIFIPNKKRSELGRFLTAMKGLRMQAIRPPPRNPRVREHAQPLPQLRTPNQYKGALLERYEHEQPCCDTCAISTDAGEFEESKHPRGQPENKGEFVKKGQGSKRPEGHTSVKGYPDLPLRRVREMAQRGAFNFEVGPGYSKNHREIIITAPASDDIKTIGEGRRTNQYDPKYAGIQVLNADEPIIRREVGRLKPEYDQDVPLEHAPGKMFRGMSSEEYESFLKTGKIESEGGHNLGGQEGLTYWSDDPLMAQSYANGFAPAQYKPTFQRPCYIVVAKKVDPKDIRKIKGTDEEEIGVARPVLKDEVLEVWRGKVGVFQVGSESFRVDEDGKYLESAGGSSPSADVVWEKVGTTKDALGESPYYAPVYTELPPVGEEPFEEVYAQALAFPERERILPEQWLPAQYAEDDFEESAHPRGQPENAGEFAAKPVRAPMIAARPDRSDFPEHIKKLVVPPAWTNVHYSADPAADLLVIGRDAKGRRQPIYNAKYLQENALAKFGRVRQLEDLYSKVTATNEANRQSALPIIRDVADCTKLVMATGIRPGSDKDTGAKVKAYGATTLLGQHVHADASGVSLKFRGKKGVMLTIPVTDPSTADMLRRRAKQAGPDGKLFPSTNDKKLQGYIKQLSGGVIHPKDFRTYLGTSTALGAIRMMPAPQTELAYKKSVHEVAKRVAQKLGNTIAVALVSYINPVVFAEWRAGLGMIEGANLGAGHHVGAD